MIRRTSIDALLFGIIAVWVGMATTLVSGQATMADKYVIFTDDCSIVGNCPLDDGATCDCTGAFNVQYGNCVFSQNPAGCPYDDDRCAGFDFTKLMPCSCQNGCG